jgi:hypothetical protein
MNRIQTILLLLLTTSIVLCGATQEVLVELKTGLRQKAILVGIAGDTVTLSGQVKGKYALVKMEKSKIKSLRSLPDSMEIPLETSPIVPVPTPVAPVVPTPAPIATPGPEPEPAPALDDTTAEAPPPHDWLGHLVVLPIEVVGVDSSLRSVFQTMTVQLLREAGKLPVIIADTAELSGIQTPVALLEKIRSVGALGFLGSQWRAHGDSVSVQFRTAWANNKVYRNGAGSRSARSSWSKWILSEEPWGALEKAIGIPLFEKKPKTKSASIWVESEPDGALISLNGQAPSCKSPCRIITRVDSPSVATIWASWQVERNLWAGRSVIPLRAGDSLSTLIKLEPTHAIIQISTHPAGAKVYSADKIWSPSLRPIGSTPLLYDGFGPGEVQFRVTLPGYRDSIVKFVPDPLGRTQYHVNMLAISDPEQLHAQQIQLRAQFKSTVGKGIMGSAAGPIIAGGLLYWLANSDFDRASKIKSELELPSSGTGPNYLAQVKKNKDAVNQGNNKVIAGSILMGIGAATFALGFTLWF